MGYPLFGLPWSNLALRLFIRNLTNTLASE